MNIGSKKLDDILSSEKTKTDKHGIGYTDVAFTLIAKGKNCLIKSSIETNHVVNVANIATKKKNVLLSESIPTCHLCGTKGHI